MFTEFLIYAGALVVLLTLNGFFVLAEFAIVKVRSSRIQELSDEGDPRAPLVADIQRRLDDYLAVCQVGITLASVALGMVGQMATDAIQGGSGSTLRYAMAMAVSYVVVAGSHIVIGELVPKSLAIRMADKASLHCAKPLRFFHRLFFLPLWILNKLANVVIRMMGFPAYSDADHHTEEELRIILDRSQLGGLLSFRRLLYIENVFDLGELKAKDVMVPRSKVKILDQRRSWDENEAVIRGSHYSRFPLIADDGGMPVGFIHVKDLLFAKPGEPLDLDRIKRPLHIAQETQPLEGLLADMQRRRSQFAILLSADGRWTGMASFEDLIEEIVGTVTDEFETETPLLLADTITSARVVLDIEAGSIAHAVRAALTRVPAGELPQSSEDLARAVCDRERLAPTYLGRNIAMPHARLVGLEKPVMIFARSAKGVPVEGNAKEKAHLFFILLTPSGQPRIHQKMQARIAAILENSEYVVDRLREAATPAEILETIRTGEQAAID